MSTSDGAPLRLEYEIVGLPAHSCRPPVNRPWIVARQRLVERLCASADADVVVIAAPAGYGKTTLALLWDLVDKRPFAWVNLESSDDDPVHLLQHVAVSLQEVAPLPADLVRTLTGAGRSVDTELLPALTGEIERRPPFVLVLDDVHVLTSLDAMHCLTGIMGCVPEGSELVFVGRSVPNVTLQRHRMDGSVVDVTATDLVMDEGEATQLLTRSGLALDDDEVEELVHRTEGWPGGLRLAALALARPRSDKAGSLLSDRDPLVADYLVEQVLSILSGEITSFLERSSILERMSASLLDELLETHGSGDRIEQIEHMGNTFLIPLDDERLWYRYHHLFAEMLRDRLERREPAVARRLHSRASALSEAGGDLDGAIRHAIAAGERERAADLILSQAFGLTYGGRSARLGVWLELLGPDAADQIPAAAIGWGWFGVARADGRIIDQAIAAAERSSVSGPLADGSPSVGVAVAMIRCVIGAHGVPAVVRDAETVRQGGDSSTNPWWAFATGAQGAALSMLGDLEQARERLRSALPAVRDQPGLEAAGLAQLALLELYTDDLAEADHLASRALQLARTYNLQGVVPLAPVFAVGACVAARRRRMEEAEENARTASLLLTRLGDLSPRTALLCYLLLARTGRALGHLAQARVWLEEAQRARHRDPSATYLNFQVDELRGQLAEGADLLELVVEPLTAAELRVLAYLPTHLSLQEIGDRLVISRNTAKTHAVAIYRKLGARSRSEAVEVARRYGLLEAELRETV